MKKIVEYSTVSSMYITNINEGVNERIEEGWQPFGNLILGLNHNGKKTYTQPIVKYEEKTYTQPIVKYEEKTNSDLIISEKIVADWIKKYNKEDNKKQLND